MNLQKYFGFMAILAALTVAPVAMAGDDNHRHTTHASAKKGGYISAQKAGQIARSRVKNSRVQKVEFDGDDNYGAVYEVDWWQVVVLNMTSKSMPKQAKSSMSELTVKSKATMH